MINEITIEGVVTREPWIYDKDVFFRIASYRDIDLPAKPATSSPGRTTQITSTSAIRVAWARQQIPAAGCLFADGSS